MEPVERPQSQTRALGEVAWSFLRLGCTAFGGPAAHIALMREEFVVRRKWLSQERFADLLGVANLIPGPSSTELAIYLGYLHAGWPGLVLAGICFIGPAMLMVLALAWAYVTYGTLPQIGWLFYGIQPVVVAIVAQAVWNLGRTILKGPLAGVVAVLVLVLYLLGFNVLILLFGGALLFGLLRWLQTRWRAGKTPVASIALPFLPLSLYALRQTVRLLALSLEQVPGRATLARFGSALLAIAPAVSLGLLFLIFLKMGAVVYGSGYTLLAFLRADLVENLHWMSERQLLDAVAIGQFTPGPVFTTATFIGYVLAGWPGALLATLGIFLPSFLFIPLIHPLASRLRNFAWTAALLDGVNAAALALMTGVLVQLGQRALSDLVTWILALLTFVILVRFKPNSVWLILAGAVVGLARFWLFQG